jgi:hypothetical protein
MPMQQQHTYTVNGKYIKKSDEVKYLGITLTSDIVGKTHL